MGIDADKPESLQLLMGNEAIARQASEAGIGVATAYPGTPSSEVIATLAKVAKQWAFMSSGLSMKRLRPKLPLLLLFRV